MTDIQKELEPIVDSYYNELISQDTSVLNGYKFSEKYLKRKEELIAQMSPQKAEHRHSIRRKVIIALIAAALIRTITVAAYEPARRFFMSLFSGHTEVTPADDSSDTETHKSVIEKKYSITVPDGYMLDEANLIDTDTYVIYTYYNSDKSDTLVFEQTVKSAFKEDIDNEHDVIVTNIDRNGCEFLVHSIIDKSTIIMWDNGEYVFKLYGSMTESELMDIYYSVK